MVTGDDSGQAKLRVGHILFVDVVGFSKLKMDQQLRTIDRLEELALSCPQVSRRARGTGYLLMPTGDGFALAFLDSPDAPLLCALELTAKSRKANIPCRMGLHMGPVYLREDINQQLNLTGGGINLAQRVMDFGDAGHVLASSDVRNLLAGVKDEYEALFHYLGLYRAKHGVTIELYNVFDDAVGNQNAPTKGRIMGGHRRLSGPDDPLLRPARPMVGRAPETEDIGSLLTAEEPLIIVTGGPGAGKTELCKAALREWLSVDPGRVVHYVGLEGAEEVTEFESRLAVAYGVPSVAGREALLYAAGQAAGVLYLDNLEGLLVDPEAVRLLQELGEVPGTIVLASSREQLPGMGRQFPVQALAPEHAVQLFLEECGRCGALLEDSPDLQQFVDRELGRHPLTLVLVAAQVPSYLNLESLTAAWREEGTRLARLYRGPQDRLTNLDVSISLSLNSLRREPHGDGAITLWGLMVFFPEGMSEEAWQFLSERAGIATDSLALLARLNIIAAASLQMLPPLRKYAERMALSGQEPFDIDRSIETAHAYFLHVARQAQEHLFDDQHLATLDALLSEFGNIHQYMTTVCRHRGRLVEQISKLSHFLENFYQYRAPAGLDMLGALIPPQREAGLDRALAGSLEYLGDLEGRLGQVDEAQAHYPEAIQLFRQEDDNLGLANAIKSLGDLESRLCQVDEAQAHYLKAIQLYRQERANLGLANAIKSLGDLESRLGNIDEAQAHYLEAIQLYRHERHNLGLANAITSLGDLESRLGQVDQAQAHYLEAIALYRQERDNLGLANAITSLGDLERRLGQVDEAQAHYLEAIQLFRQERHNLGLANAIKSLGDLERRLGQVDEAQAHYLEAIQLYRQQRNNLGLANAIRSLGDLESRLGKVDEAQAHYLEAIQLYRQERANLGLANVFQSQGDLLRGQRRLSEATALYEQARALYTLERGSMGLAYTCCRLARVCHAQGDSAARDSYMHEALARAKDSNIPLVVQYVETVRAELGL